MEKIDFSMLTRHMKEIRNTQINIGTGEEVSIAELAELIKETIGFNGIIEYDAGKPDGTPRKLTDVSKLGQLGWTYKTPLSKGIRNLYRWYKGYHL